MCQSFQLELSHCITSNHLLFFLKNQFIICVAGNIQPRMAVFSVYSQVYAQEFMPGDTQDTVCDARDVSLQSKHCKHFSITPTVLYNLSPPTYLFCGAVEQTLGLKHARKVLLRYHPTLKGQSLQISVFFHLSIHFNLLVFSVRSFLYPKNLFIVTTSNQGQSDCFPMKLNKSLQLFFLSIFYA